MVERVLNWSWILVSSWVCQEGVFKLLAGPRFLVCNIRVYPRVNESSVYLCVNTIPRERKATSVTLCGSGTGWPEDSP